MTSTAGASSPKRGLTHPTSDPPCPPLAKGGELQLQPQLHESWQPHVPGASHSAEVVLVTSSSRLMTLGGRGNVGGPAQPAALGDAAGVAAGTGQIPVPRLGGRTEGNEQPQSGEVDMAGYL